MNIQLIYWKSVLGQYKIGQTGSDKFREHSTQEQQAFDRLRSRHANEQFIRYS